MTPFTIRGRREKATLKKDSPVLLVDSGGYIVIVIYETVFASGERLSNLCERVNL